MRHSHSFGFGLLLLLLIWVIPVGAQNRTAFEHSEILIKSKNGDHKFQVEIARAPDQLRLGLMYRRLLATDAGMLFDYGQSQKVTMWMKNTLIPLDMLFIDAAGRIVKIRERAVPGSQENISSMVPIRGVLELNGGTVSRLGISRGDTVRHEIFLD
ncbi:MAG: hypothetical protein CFH10_01822 [Alphaproteobacteria bacterium MarineAlpha4_Bin2]|nr:MAG: hypothetical protein CFH10_01822 [Alphaproteobacteria bacterium MarineAlpha4_Bin2]